MPTFIIVFYKELTKLKLANKFNLNNFDKAYEEALGTCVFTLGDLLFILGIRDCTQGIPPRKADTAYQDGYKIRYELEQQL